jgi:hypothetical protein
MPHADPTWETHGRLFSYNEECKGSIWLGCHAGSALEDMWDNADNTELYVPEQDGIDYTQQTNFLSTKDGNVPSGENDDYYPNALILWGDHDSGTLPYSYAHHDDPIMQFMGILDAATQNGSEQIYIPVHTSAGWRTSTIVGVYDPDHPDALNGTTHAAAVLAYGRGFGDDNRGYVMLEASHSIAKSSGTANVAAQRAFFNYSLVAILDKVAVPVITGIPADGILYAGQTYNFDVTYPDIVPSGASYEWFADCGGTFSPSATNKSVTYTPPAVSGPINCRITVTVTDDCGRISFDNESVLIKCDMAVSTAITNPCNGDPNGGAIDMTITGANSPFVYSWTETGGGSGSGSGTTITGLAAGDYTITVTGSNGAGCTTTFSVSLTESPAIVLTPTANEVTCNGELTGSVDLAVSGGIPGYTFSWTGPDGFTASTQNISGLKTGGYSVTVTDSKGCTASTSAVVDEPDAIGISPVVTDVLCRGESTGEIALTISGGVSPYTFAWNDGNSDEDRTGLDAGTYSVTVTDANGCTETQSNIEVGEPASAIALGETHVNVLCGGDNTGSIDLTASGGTPLSGGPPFYTYSWTGPGGFTASTEDISNLINGDYEVSVTDANGCTEILTVTVETTATIVITSVITHPTCPPDAGQNGDDGAIDITVTGGATPYTNFSWTASGGGIVPAGQENNEDLTGLVAGTYTVTVTDSNGCTETATMNLNYLNPNPVQPASINN